MTCDLEALTVALDHITVRSNPSSGRVVVTMTLSTELSDATALNLVLKVVDAVVRMGDDDL